MPVKFAAILPHLNERYAASLPVAVAKLEEAIASGLVPNVQFNEAKSTINYAVEKSVEAFLNSGPHEAKHHQSDWWLGAYHNDAFGERHARHPGRAEAVARKAGNLKAYEAFLNELLAAPRVAGRGQAADQEKGRSCPRSRARSRSPTKPTR